MIESPVLPFLLILLAGEIVALSIYQGVFRVIPRLRDHAELDWGNVAEGVVERTFLFFAFANGFEVALLFFGTLKIATHLTERDETPDKMVFLIGNLVSAGLAIGYFVIYTQV